MSLPDYPVETEAKQILAAQKELAEKVDRLTDALNGVGANVQWMIDNVKGIFEMFSSPQFMSMLPSMVPTSPAVSMEASDHG